MHFDWQVHARYFRTNSNANESMAFLSGSPNAVCMVAVPVSLNTLQLGKSPNSGFFVSPVETSSCAKHLYQLRSPASALYRSAKHLGITVEYVAHISRCPWVVALACQGFGISYACRIGQSFAFVRVSLSRRLRARVVVRRLRIRHCCCTTGRQRSRNR